MLPDRIGQADVLTVWGQIYGHAWKNDGEWVLLRDVSVSHYMGVFIFGLYRGIARELYEADIINMRGNTP